MVHRMEDFGVHSHLQRPLPGRACSWESPQCWLCREVGFVAEMILECTATCSVLLPVELAPGNGLSAGCGGRQAVLRTGSAVDTSKQSPAKQLARSLA
jgi:hypothetical protein